MTSIREAEEDTQTISVFPEGLQHVDLSDLDNFAERGYCVVRNAVSAEELAALREAYDSIVANSKSLPEPSRSDFRYRPIIHDNAPGEESPLSRIEYNYDKSPVFFSLLGHPIIALIASKLLDGPGLNTWEDMVIKAPGSQPVGMHQDNLNIEQSEGTVFDIAVYFDDSDHDPLIVYPGTQTLGNLTLDDCEEIASSGKHEAVEVPVKAGDLLMHNVRAIHGSRANYSQLTRRVLYFEFRTIEQVRNSSPWSESWLQKRLPYVMSAMKYRAESHAPYTLEESELRDEAMAAWVKMHPDLKPLSIDELDLRVDHDDFS